MVLMQQPFDPTARHLTHRRPTRPLAIVDWLTSGAMTDSYSIIEDEEGPAHPRISAVNASDVEIAGAFQPPQRGYWLLYVTPLLAAAAGIECRPDPLPLYGREEAKQWVSLVAQLYVKAAS
jgi:hypothetical protein